MLEAGDTIRNGHSKHETDSWQTYKHMEIMVDYLHLRVKKRNSYLQVEKPNDLFYTQLPSGGQMRQAQKPKEKIQILSLNGDHQKNTNQ